MADYNQIIESVTIPMQLLAWLVPTVAPSLVYGASLAGDTAIVHWNITPSAGQQSIASNLVLNWDTNAVSASNATPTIDDVVTFSNINYASGKFVVFNSQGRRDYEGTLDGSGEIDLTLAIADTYDIHFLNSSETSAAYLQIEVTEA